MPMLDSLNVPLSEDELTSLAVFLHDMNEPITLECLDGYLAALVCSPRLVMPNQFITEILGEHEFKNEEEVKSVTSAILRLWNTISNHLSRNKIYKIILTRFQYDEQNEFLGYEWSVGFLTGMATDKKSWDLLVEDEEFGNLLMPMIALAKDYEEFRKIQIKQISEEERIKIIDAIQQNLPLIYNFFSKERKKNIAHTNKKSLHYAKVKKIGRNEPCPCGSNRKYKHCCGKN